MSRLVLRRRFFVETCTKKFSYCRDVFGEVWLLSGLVRRVDLVSGRVRRGLVRVVTFSARSS